MFLGIDIGSTSIKVILLDTDLKIIWKRYLRHETRQTEKLLELLTEIEQKFKVLDQEVLLFCTGSGGREIANILGGRYIQEVNSISSYVEKKYTDVNSVIELGGQDAKIIIFLRDEATGRVKKITTMNDKCAGGTGVIIDKIASKLKISPDDISKLTYKNIRIHNIAGKCGVFAETDINGLQKLGVPPRELMASLFDSIVQQNLSVLTRGNTLKPKVLLLGGPNTFIKGMVEAWQENIPKIWQERSIDINKNIPYSDLITVPENSEYFAAIGAVYFGLNFETDHNFYKGSAILKKYFDTEIESQKINDFKDNATPLFFGVKEFEDEYSIEPFIPPDLKKSKIIEAYLGIDGGSTTTKAVLMDKNSEVIRKYYQLSLGNPIDDVKEILTKLLAEMQENQIVLKILGVGVTGYAKNIIKDAINADVSIVETIAHAQAALHYYKKVDVICDVGGQDIKIMMLKNNAIVDFKLNTQCSAGNGYFLQNTAESFGIGIKDFAGRAFKVNRYPNFGYGCGVFLQSDIVNFQRKGWTPDEILAGLACVLPKNIWLYVCQIPNLPRFGTNFILQGGTQYNKAAAKAQVDFIQDRFRENGMRANIKIHRYAGECGAIGAALEARKINLGGKSTSFIGLEKVQQIRYTSSRNEETRCIFCKNHCLRTFIDIETSTYSDYKHGDNFSFKSGAEQERTGRLESYERLPDNDKKEESAEPKKTRVIIASCEKGTAENVKDMKEILKEINEIKSRNPNLIEFASKNIWNNYDNSSVFASNLNKNKFQYEKRSSMVFGIPRALNLYQYAPFFIGYLESLGIKKHNIIFSDFTTEKLYRDGSKRGSIDPCYPSKVTLSHIHDLIYKQNLKKKINFVLFPIVDTIPSELVDTVDHKACPASLATPEVVKAAFTKESDLFKKNDLKFLNPFINLDNPDKCTYQMYQCFKSIFDLSWKENEFAIRAGYKSLEKFEKNLKEQGKKVLRQIENENRIGLVFLGRPYHNDYGLNHGIPEEFQKLGYPIFSIDSLPTDTEMLNELFEKDIQHGLINSPLDISDVWKNSFSENTNKKIWAAKFIARHRNLVAIELSNFKCGHDATTYSVVRDILNYAGGVFFSFRDIDENKPTSSIKIRIETIDYFLKNYVDPSLKFKNGVSIKNVIPK
jgi:predicted CoA-substrate-specific enzyme activase